MYFLVLNYQDIVLGLETNGKGSDAKHKLSEAEIGRSGAQQSAPIGKSEAECFL